MKRGGTLPAVCIALLLLFSTVQRNVAEPPLDNGFLSKGNMHLCRSSERETFILQPSADYRAKRNTSILECGLRSSVYRPMSLVNNEDESCLDGAFAKFGYHAQTGKLLIPTSHQIYIHGFGRFSYRYTPPAYRKDNKLPRLTPVLLTKPFPKIRVLCALRTVVCAVGTAKWRFYVSRNVDGLLRLSNKHTGCGAGGISWEPYSNELSGAHACRRQIREQLMQGRTTVRVGGCLIMDLNGGLVNLDCSAGSLIPNLCRFRESDQGSSWDANTTAHTRLQNFATIKQNLTSQQWFSWFRPQRYTAAYDAVRIRCTRHLQYGYGFPLAGRVVRSFEQWFTYLDDAHVGRPWASVWSPPGQELNCTASVRRFDGTMGAPSNRYLFYNMHRSFTYLDAVPGERAFPFVWRCASATRTYRSQLDRLSIHQLLNHDRTLQRAYGFREAAFGQRFLYAKISTTLPLSRSHAFSTPGAPFNYSQRSSVTHGYSYQAGPTASILTWLFHPDRHNGTELRCVDWYNVVGTNIVMRKSNTIWLSLGESTTFPQLCHDNRLVIGHIDIHLSLNMSLGGRGPYQVAVDERVRQLRINDAPASLNNTSLICFAAWQFSQGQLSEHSVMIRLKNPPNSPRAVAVTLQSPWAGDFTFYMARPSNATPTGVRVRCVGINSPSSTIVRTYAETQWGGAGAGGNLSLVKVDGLTPNVNYSCSVHALSFRAESAPSTFPAFFTMLEVHRVETGKSVTVYCSGEAGFYNVQKGWENRGWGKPIGSAYAKDIVLGKAPGANTLTLPSYTAARNSFHGRCRELAAPQAWEKDFVFYTAQFCRVPLPSNRSLVLQVGETATNISCKPGYTPSRPFPNVTCLAHGEYFPLLQPTDCIPDCPALDHAGGLVAGGKTVSAGTAVGSTFTVTCLNGYQLVGDGTVSCQAVSATTSTWSPLPRCDETIVTTASSSTASSTTVLVTSSQPEASTEAAPNSSQNNSANSSESTSALPTFSGTTASTTFSDTTASTPAPAANCPDFNDALVPNGRAAFDNGNSRSSTLGTTFTVRCSVAGHELVGNRTVTCLALNATHSSWSPLPKCNPTSNTFSRSEGGQTTSLTYIVVGVILVAVLAVAAAYVLITKKRRRHGLSVGYDAKDSSPGIISSSAEEEAYATHDSTVTSIVITGQGAYGAYDNAASLNEPTYADSTATDEPIYAGYEPDRRTSCPAISMAGDDTPERRLSTRPLMQQSPRGSCVSLGAESHYSTGRNSLLGASCGSPLGSQHTLLEATPTDNWLYGDASSLLTVSELNQSRDNQGSPGQPAPLKITRLRGECNVDGSKEGEELHSDSPQGHYSNNWGEFFPQEASKTDAKENAGAPTSMAGAPTSTDPVVYQWTLERVDTCTSDTEVALSDATFETKGGVNLPACVFDALVAGSEERYNLVGAMDDGFALVDCLSEELPQTVFSSAVTDDDDGCPAFRTHDGVRVPLSAAFRAEFTAVSVSRCCVVSRDDLTSTLVNGDTGEVLAKADRKQVLAAMPTEVTCPVQRTADGQYAFEGRDNEMIPVSAFGVDAVDFGGGDFLMVVASEDGGYSLYDRRTAALLDRVVNRAQLAEIAASTAPVEDIYMLVSADQVAAQTHLLADLRAQSDQAGATASAHPVQAEEDLYMMHMAAAAAAPRFANLVAAPKIVPQQAESIYATATSTMRGPLPSAVPSRVLKHIPRGIYAKF